MRKLSIILGAGLLMAACAFAAPQEATISVATGTVTLAVTQPSGNTITLATKGIAATTLFRPRLDGTDTAGAALTSDPPGRYLSYGDTWTLTVAAASVTGKTWRVWIKYDDRK